MKQSKIILICRDFSNKKILNKFNSLKNEFKEANFEMISYQECSAYDNLINVLPSWIIESNERQDIVSGDVLITPLRKFIRDKIGR